MIIVATLLAVGLRLYDLSRPGYLFGISEYDDGTDFGSAIRLVHGAYRTATSSWCSRRESR